MKGSPYKLLSIIIANMGFAILVLIEPIFFQKVIDTLLSFQEQQDNEDILKATLLLWFGVGFITIGARLFVSIFADRFSHMHFNYAISNIFSHISNLSMRFHMDTNSGELVKKITKGTEGIFEIQLQVLRRFMPNFFTIIILIPLVLYFHFYMGVFVVIMGGISAVVSLGLMTYVFTKQEKIEYLYSEMSSHYSDTFSNAGLIKSFVLGDFVKSKLHILLEKKNKQQFPILTGWGIIVSLGQILKILISLGVLAFGSYLFLIGEITIGEIVMFLGFSLIFLSAIEDMTWGIELIFWRIAGVKDYFNILDTIQEVQDIQGAEELSGVKGNVVFDAVNFSYDGKRQILKNINIDVKPGEKVAFVGHTGSGKTTMTNLILRFFDPQEGKVFIDGKNIAEMTQDSLRKNIGVVFQDNSLFNTTIENNIRLDSERSTREDIEKVAKKAHASEFISRLSEGLDTVVGERGVKLSGGEKQRLAIARAFLKDAPILILDEATSALDAETEKYLQGSFDELMQGRTTFIIAHRLSTIMKADRIFVFDEGKIVEEGSYKDLLAKKGKFHNLVEAQTQGFIE